MIKIPRPKDLEKLAVEAGISLPNACRRAGFTANLIDRWRSGVNEPSIESIRSIVSVLQKQIDKPPKANPHKRRNALFRTPHLEKAIARAGGVLAVAEAVGVTKQAVSFWSRVPKKHLLTVSALSGMPPHVLRPDISEPPGDNV